MQSILYGSTRLLATICNSSIEPMFSRHNVGCNILFLTYCRGVEVIQEWGGEGSPVANVLHILSPSVTRARTNADVEVCLHSLRAISWSSLVYHSSLPPIVKGLVKLLDGKWFRLIRLEFTGQGSSCTA